ncbi:MAG TPA: NADH-quinone oxidoreductase subunit L [Terriglobales bacterium]|nr:NADH-quinone oxidoreductase subunit L [Terriglobales bacterium]
MTSSSNLYLWLIPILPLIGAAINGIFGKRFPRSLVAAIALVFPGAALVQAFWVAAQFAHLTQAQIPHIERLLPWIEAGQSFRVDFGFYLDQLSLTMLLIVTGVGFLIHIYSVGYMAEEGGYYRFFSYLNLFMFFMLTLVLAHSYLLMFVGWEGVGLASYLLIGFFFLKDSAAQAGKKAFITNRVGDFAFLLGMFQLIQHFGTLDYDKVFKAVSSLPVETGVGFLTATALLIMVGATGKSAQIPLYVWLPDAMEGPTPVSALIHAATMVTAGIYMIARSNVLFLHAPTALRVVAIIGALTAIFAASIGLVQNDIKRVLAYSTVSQLGYMFMACGVAAFSAGIFHLMTHAFFKALLFLAAGSVIHALGGEQDLRHMGGLRKLIPWTFWTMTIATFAIAGFPPLSGFFSKDEILWKAFSDKTHGSWIFWLIGWITAGMTSFYMFRLWFLTFFGERRQPIHDEHQEPSGAVHAPSSARADLGHQSGVQTAHAGAHGHSDHGHAGHVHESPWVMLAPLVVLAIGSIVVGWVGIPEALRGHNNFDQFLTPVFHTSSEPARSAENFITEPQQSENPESEKGLELELAAASVGVGVLGLFLAWFFYYRRPELPDRIVTSMRGAYRTLLNKYWVDEAYYATLINPIVNGSRAVLWRGIDVGVIDALVNGAGTTSKGISGVTRRMQSGSIRSYAGWVALGAACVVAFMIWMGLHA